VLDIVRYDLTTLRFEELTHCAGSCEQVPNDVDLLVYRITNHIFDEIQKGQFTSNVIERHLPTLYRFEPDAARRVFPRCSLRNVTRLFLGCLYQVYHTRDVHKP